MVVTYLLILTWVVGYACWRGYQLEGWVGELSKSVGQLTTRIADTEHETVCLDKWCDGLAARVGNAEVDLRDLSGALYMEQPKKPAKKPRGKK